MRGARQRWRRCTAEVRQPSSLQSAAERAVYAMPTYLTSNRAVFHDTMLGSVLDIFTFRSRLSRWSRMDEVQDSSHYVLTANSKSKLSLKVITKMVHKVFLVGLIYLVFSI